MSHRFSALDAAIQLTKSRVRDVIRGRASRSNTHDSGMRLGDGAADQETLVLLKGFSRDPGVAKARVEFERAQKAEERFHKDFDGQDCTER